MKKIFIAIALIVVACLILTGCKYSGNRQILDTTYNFSRAIVYAPDGTKVAEGKVTNWRDFDDSDQLQVCINGKTYLSAAENIILIAE